MEYIFSQNNRKILIYDEGNNIYYNVILGNKIVQAKVIARDYHTGLSCFRFEDKIYCAYITVAKELMWENITDDSKLVLFADKNEIWNMDNVVMENIYDTLVIFYQVINPSNEKYEIRYLMPLKDKKGRVIVSLSEIIERYKFIRSGEMIFLAYELKGEDERNYYLITREEGQGLDKCEYGFNEKQLHNELLNELADLKTKYENDLKSTKLDYEERLKEDISLVEEHYRSQYEELSSFTKDIQNEGKKWRELYYRSTGKK